MHTCSRAGLACSKGMGVFGYKLLQEFLSAGSLRICKGVYPTSLQAEADAVEYEYVSAPHEYEGLLAPKQEGDDAEGSGHVGLGAGASSGGGLGFMSAGADMPGLGSAGGDSHSRTNLLSYGASILVKEHVCAIEDVYVAPD